MLPIVTNTDQQESNEKNLGTLLWINKKETKNNLAVICTLHLWVLFCDIDSLANWQVQFNSNYFFFIKLFLIFKIYPIINKQNYKPCKASNLSTYQIYFQAF